MNYPDKVGFFRSLFGVRPSPRRPPLPLYLPLQTRVEKEPAENIEALWNQITEQRLSPLLLLQELNRYLDRINPLPLPYEQRLRIGNILLGELGTAISGLFSRFFQGGGGVPETREQREGISLAARAAEQLAIGYKLVFRADWGGEPDSDRVTDERLVTCGLRVLECLRLEQLLRAFRYQKLPVYVWRDANQLFFALREGWDIKTRLPLKVRFSVGDAGGSLDLFPATAALEELYLAIQLTGLLDVVTWPIQLMYRACAYLRHLEEAPAVLADSGDALTPGQAIIYRNRGAPPAFERNPRQAGESLLIDLAPLLAQVSGERAALQAAPAAPVGETLRAMPPRERIALLDMLLQRLKPQRRRDPRQRVFDPHRARVYGGFETIYRLFRESAAAEPPPAEFHPSQSLEAASEPGAGGGIRDSRWLVADEGPGGIQLRQQESAYSLPLFVGRLLAYQTGDPGATECHLGYLVRMQRRGEDEVEVAVARLQGEIRAAVVEDLDALDRQPLPALLIHERDGKLRLLCDNRRDFFAGKRLAVGIDDHHYTAVLGEAVLIRGDFTVFELHTAEAKH